MDIILIPGLWLDASSWADVVPVLEQAGHRAHPLTLPGMESRDADRTAISLRDHVDAVVAVIDALDPAAGDILLVGHSAGAAIAHAAVDARPDRVARAVYVGGFPAGHGDALAPDYPAAGGDVPLPAWSQFEEEELADLDDEALAAFRERAIPSPEGVARDPQQLSDDRRYAVPVVVIATEFTSAMLQDWMAQGLAPVQELSRIRDVRHVDLPTGHWPQFTRPRELAGAILELSRPEPPHAGDEAATVLGFLEFHRATLAWKISGLDAAGLAATLAPSSMTLGGLVKHIAYVEDDWFTRVLWGREPPAPWDTVDWAADRDWDWHSAADDTPDELARPVGRQRGPLARRRRRGSRRRRSRPAGPAVAAGPGGAHPALDPGAHGRGVRPAQRPRRPPPRVGRRARRRVTSRARRRWPWRASWRRTARRGR